MRLWTIVAVGWLYGLASCEGSATEEPSSGAGGSSAGGGAAGMAADGGTGVFDGTVEPGPLSGQWNGYAENFKFNDGTDTIVMMIYKTEGGVTGQVAFGQSPPLAPSTDKTKAYPPGWDYDKVGSPPGRVFSGFAYTMVDPTYDGARLRFGVSPGELLTAWCKLQTPVEDENHPGDYACRPNWSGGNDGSGCFLFNPHTQQKEPIDCGVMMLCAPSGCTCTAQECGANPTAALTLDMQIGSSKADGSVAGFDENPHNVHFAR